MKRSDFIDYRNKHYVASATTVIVSGNIKEAEAIRKITKAFSNVGKWKKEEKKKTSDYQKEPKVLLEHRDTDQAHLILGVRTFDTYNKYNPIIHIIEGILSGGMSSRLFQKMREELGITYYIHAENDAFTDHGVFAVACGANNERVKEAIIAILEELNKLKIELVGKEELEKVKQHIIGSMHLGLESSDSVASFLGAQEILRKKLKTPEEIIKEIKAVTAEEIKFVAERIFKTETLNLAMVGKFKEEKEFRNILKL